MQSLRAPHACSRSSDFALNKCRCIRLSNATARKRTQASSTHLPSSFLQKTTSRNASDQAADRMDVTFQRRLRLALACHQIDCFLRRSFEKRNNNAVHTVWQWLEACCQSHIHGANSLCNSWSLSEAHCDTCFCLMQIALMHTTCRLQVPPRCFIHRVLLFPR